MDMIWHQKKYGMHVPVESMSQFYAGQLQRKNALPGENGAKASVNLSFYNFPMLKTAFLRPKKRSKIPVF
jgi:hypothetical protein